MNEVFSKIFSKSIEHIIKSIQCDFEGSSGKTLKMAAPNLMCGNDLAGPKMMVILSKNKSDLSGMQGKGQPQLTVSD